MLEELFGLEEGEVDCTVCLCEPKDIVLLPCRHVCICHQCHANVTKVGFMLFLIEAQCVSTR